MAPQGRTILHLSTRDTATLPAKLLTNIPTCAQECIGTAVNETYVPGKCNSASDAQCLCTHYSSTGYSLGELSLSCLYANCPTSTRNESSHEVFNICSGYPSAVSATHNVLTLTTMKSASPTDSISATTSSSDVHATQTTLSTAIRTYQTGQGSTVTSTSTPTTTTLASETSSVPSTTPTRSPNALTTGQVVGVSLASVGLAGLLVGLVFLCCCLRRRKKTQTPINKSFKSKHSSFDFVDKSPPGSPLRGPSKTASHAQEWWRNTGPSYPAINRVSSGHRSHRASVLPGFVVQGSAPFSEPRRHSFRIPASRPVSGKASGHLRPDSSATGLTMFEEDCRSPSYKKTLSKPPCLPKPVFLPPIIPSPSFTDRYTTSPEDMQQTSLSLKIPRLPRKHDELPVPGGLGPTSPNSLRAAHVSMPPSSAVSYLPAYYTSNDSRTPVAPVGSPWCEDSRFSHPEYAPKPLVPKGVRSSFASDTTFESVDPDETTPENEEDKQLSPVSYPKVPRPSNQAIPRSPLQSLSPRINRRDQAAKRAPTLISKRRGDDMAHDLERGLVITNANGSFRSTSRATVDTTNVQSDADSPLKAYGGAQKSSSFLPKSESLQMVMKSPLWEPELTPSRRGEDLYISVELKRQ